MAFGIGKMFYSRNIFYKYKSNIKIESVNIKNCGYTYGGRN